MSEPEFGRMTGEIRRLLYGRSGPDPHLPPGGGIS
jgi:hypothetical protein